jgi:uncharacterized membrane protein
MRVTLVGAAVVGLAAVLCGCADSGTGPAVSRVDPQEAAERAIIGAAAGAALGTGFGAIVSINPGLGAVIGAESGAAVGAAIGIATAQPIPDYTPIALPTVPVIPGFYDTWPPGYHQPPIGSQTPPPHPG